jgi:DNA repair protein RadC
LHSESLVKKREIQDLEITSSERAYEVLKCHLVAEVEEFWAMALSSSKKVLAVKMLFRGTVDNCQVHPRELFRFACLSHASSLVIAHNHPYGTAEPSYQDIALTLSLIQAARLIEIPILDHLILTQKDYVSLADRGYFKAKERLRLQ